ncbi:aminotransferase class I/II-fold pyridoxal phosphate-dependent enzyme [Mesorhizobium sp. M1403]
MIILTESDVDKQRFRDLASVIEKSRSDFDYAYSKGIMTLYARSLKQRHVELEPGRSVIEFARGSYLGLDNHPMIVNAAIAALASYRSIQWSGARTRLNFSLTRDLEYSLSELFDARVIVYSLVLTANMSALPLLACGAFTRGRKPVLVFDRFAHATLAYHKAVMAEDAEVLQIRHNDTEELERICQKHTRVAYICDGVYSMGGNAPIRELLRLQERYGLFIYIDDAHGISIRGRHGQGYAKSQITDLGENTIIAASLSKGFGVTGGVLMLGTEEQENLLRRYAVPHAFSMGPDLAGIAGALASAEIHRSAELGERQARLSRVVQAFDEKMPTQSSGDGMPIRMVPIGESRAAVDAAAELLRRGFYVAAAFYPTVPRDKAALRVCLTADHSLEEVTQLCASIRDIGSVRP